ncbi:MAG: trigger factor [Raoultibacter sp.]
MNVEKRELDSNAVVLAVTLPASEVAEEIKRASIMVAYQNKITPDPARLPQEVICEKLGKETADQCVDEQIMKSLAPFALAEKSLDIIGVPKFLPAQHARKDQDFFFSMHCVPVPHFALSSYDCVEITIPPLQVAADEIEEQLAAMAQQNAVQETDEARDVVGNGDEIELTMETLQDGKRLKALCTKARPYKTGSFTMPDDFDKAIIGMKAGETKTFDFEGPSFEVDGQGKPLMEKFTTTLTVERLLKRVIPAITDAWVSVHVPDCKTVKDVRAKLEKSIYAQKEVEYLKQKDRLCANELAKRFDAKIPDAVYEAATAEARETFITQLEQQGSTLEEFLKQQNMEEQQVSMMLMMETKEQLIRQFVLNALAEHLKLEVDDEDYHAFFTSIAPGKESQARADFERGGRMFAARAAALRLKANRYLSEHATIHQACAPTA